MDSPRDPSITVVIPVWDDYVRFLPDAVESVKRDAPHVPILVVDNASITPLPEMPGTEVVRAPGRLTVGAARNLGLERVESEYVLILDADDMLISGTLEFLRARLDADSSLAVCATSILDGETGERHRTPRRFVLAFSRWRRTFALTDCIWSLFPIQGCAMLRTEQVREAGGYADANWGDDWVLAVSLAFRGRVEVSGRLGRYYRPTSESLWRQPRPLRELVASAGLVRERLRSDPAVPLWARALLPLIAAFQLIAVYAVRPVYLVGRWLRRSRNVDATEQTMVAMSNLDPSTVTGFGEEWKAFDQSRLPKKDLEQQFEQYFRVFPWDELPPDPVGFDLGCGSGRWAQCVAPRVRALHCIDASPAAIGVAQANLAAHPNCVLHVASVDNLPLASDSMDFGYCLGVLHHVPDTEGGIRACVDKLRPNAPFLIYLYYALDQRPEWFRALWRVTDITRRGASRLPHRPKLYITGLIAALIYFPLARMARMAERLGANVDVLPLSIYRDRSFYTMRTDAFDRFGTRLEKRFTRVEVCEMMESAGLERMTISSHAPYWCAVGFKRSDASRPESSGVDHGRQPGRH